MTDETKTEKTTATTLRAAAAEALLAGGFLLSDVQREKAWNADITKESEARFRRAMELLRDALSCGLLIMMFAACSPLAPVPTPAPIWDAARVERAVAVLGSAAVEVAATAAAQKNAPTLLRALDTNGDGVLQVAEILLADFTDAQVLAVALAAALELRK